jgi:hypothetical protein
VKMSKALPSRSVAFCVTDPVFSPFKKYTRALVF